MGWGNQDLLAKPGSALSFAPGACTVCPPRLAADGPSRFRERQKANTSVMVEGLEFSMPALCSLSSLRPGLQQVQQFSHFVGSKEHPKFRLRVYPGNSKENLLESCHVEKGDATRRDCKPLAASIRNRGANQQKFEPSYPLSARGKFHLRAAHPFRLYERNLAHTIV